MNDETEHPCAMSCQLSSISGKQDICSHACVQDIKAKHGLNKSKGRKSSKASVVSIVLQQSGTGVH